MKNYKKVELPGNVGWTTEYETPAFTYKAVAILTFIALAVLALR
jgi:hypothetical protein